MFFSPASPPSARRVSVFSLKVAMPQPGTSQAGWIQVKPLTSAPIFTTSCAAVIAMDFFPPGQAVKLVELKSTGVNIPIVIPRRVRRSPSKPAPRACQSEFGIFDLVSRVTSRKQKGLICISARRALRD